MKRLLAMGALTAVFAVSAQEDIPFANTIRINPGDSHELIIEKAAHVVPNERQMDALENEFIAFIHFGPNTFSRREWGTGFEDPKLFNPSGLDTDQWVKSMKDAGMKMVVITAKHHDGYVIWQSRYTDHGIMSSDFMDGKGDVLRDLAASCKKYGMKLGVYLSPADLYQIENTEGLYGNLSKKTLRTIPRKVDGRPFANDTKFEFVVDDYNEYFLNQLFELLTEYGPIHEVWFDGAHPKRKGGQTYDYASWKKLIHTLAPEAVVFGREDVRWCGNEAGATRPTEWNVITYQANPDTLNNFHDMTDEDLGSRGRLYEGGYLHYQQAETNTSIREGWFYRDDDKQGVRSADDVFDMYERAVGGNSTFMLNIPPNREGRFSPRDSSVLAEVGRRIRDTYSTNLLLGADAPDALLDGDNRSGVEIDGSIVITLPKSVTINRLMLQEPVAVNGERIEEHAVDAWVDGGWKQIANATNIGYKRILRFPDVTTDRLRIRIGSARLTPSLSGIGAYYYHSHAPEVVASRDFDGMVTISPARSDFGWKRSGDNPSENLNGGFVIHYTVDGTTPTSASPVYTTPFKAECATVSAISVLNGEESPVSSSSFGYIKNGWRVAGESGGLKDSDASKAFDGNAGSFWISAAPGAWIAVDLGRKETLRGFGYTPQTHLPGQGMIEKGEIQISDDGKKWQTVEQFEFGNLINDPTPRTVTFKRPVDARYVKIVPVSIAGGNDKAAIAEIDLF
ncbi:MAG: alpha-1,3/4-fucosidase [Bacteroides sp.]|nr:alpha-1,3/4-fucosidase [Bacteroides sp.]MBD5375815.1 alpha-1,3/4-fucosidase [Bacteroides sp.]